MLSEEAALGIIRGIIRDNKHVQTFLVETTPTVVTYSMPQEVRRAIDPEKLQEFCAGLIENFQEALAKIILDAAKSSEIAPDALRQLSASNPLLAAQISTQGMQAFFRQLTAPQFADYIERNIDIFSFIQAHYTSNLELKIAELVKQQETLASDSRATGRVENPPQPTTESKDTPVGVGAPTGTTMPRYQAQLPRAQGGDSGLYFVAKHIVAGLTLSYVAAPMIDSGLTYAASVAGIKTGPYFAATKSVLSTTAPMFAFLTYDAYQKNHNLKRSLGSATAMMFAGEVTRQLGVVKTGMLVVGAGGLVAYTMHREIQQDTVVASASQQYGLRQRRRAAPQ